MPRTAEATTPHRASDALPYRRALVIANPVAGRGRARASADELLAGLREAGMGAELYLTRERRDAARRAAALDPGTDLVIAVGGDGTVAEVLEGLPPEVPLAVLPMGTANVLCLDLRLPRRARGTLEMIRAGRTTGLDVARVNGRLSFLVTGVGIDGAIVQRVDEHRRGPITKWSYVRAALSAFTRGFRIPRLVVTLDGERLEGHWAWVLVSNIIGYGGILKLFPGRRLDDGLFEVFLFPKGSRLALLGYALRGVVRGLPGGSCSMRTARSVRIESDPPVPYEVDGDYAGQTPVEVRVSGEHFRLLIPE